MVDNTKMSPVLEKILTKTVNIQYANFCRLSVYSTSYSGKGTTWFYSVFLVKQWESSLKWVPICFFHNLSNSYLAIILSFDGI